MFPKVGHVKFMGRLSLWFFFSLRRIHREHRRWKERRIQRGWAQTGPGPRRQLLIFFLLYAKQDLPPPKAAESCDWSLCVWIRAQQTETRSTPGVEHCKVISNRLHFQCKLHILLIPSLPWLVCVGFLCSSFSNKTHGDKILITCLLLFDWYQGLVSEVGTAW